MSEDQPTLCLLERCLESLAFCHLQEESRWAAARIVAQQDIDEFLRDAGPDLAGQHQALVLLMAEFDRRFPDETDPVLIRSAMRRQMRRLGYEINRAGERAQETETAPETSAPATAPDDETGEESDSPETHRQGDARGVTGSS